MPSALNYVHPTGLRYIKTDYGIVYCATNKVTGHKYIGSTLSSLHRRKYRHEREGSCVSIFQAIKEYGSNNFDWSILEHQVPRNDLVKKENEWIDKLNTMDSRFGYNLRKSGPGGSSSDKMRKNQSAGLKKAYETTDFRIKVSVAVKKRYENFETRKKQAAKMGSNPFEAFKDGKSFGIFYTYKQAAECLNISVSGVAYVLRGKRNNAFGFTFKRLEVKNDE